MHLHPKGVSEKVAKNVTQIFDNSFAGLCLML